ncbi:DNA polymerase III subunit delta [Sphingomonas sp. ID1715]|uniref:DNA polymerase III subunit delta n=1 Tax=Sphingomonas sp. ID1715 TaxID=1656898 RepID=UPI001488AA9C|nr:DNA polymerase III subunit delta [Sphingomonas sp. ID1715]NNM77299.1 DNA polymerase III subunit delta [Sphingomonas sp. ID1715]
MKADKGTIERALAKPQARCFLLYGPDEAGSRALADRLATTMGSEAERIDLDGSTLAKDPALLADEAASSSLFGGARYIRVRANGDEITDAVEALLEAPQAGNPVAIIAGALKPASKLLKLALASPDALAFASYLPEARDAVPLVIGMAQPLGLKVAPDIARRIFDACAGDRAVIGRELEKLALFLDAAEAAPKPLDAAALEAVGAGEGESSTAALIDAVLTGAIRQATEELVQLSSAGEDGVALLRATLRRLLQLAALRSEADRTSLAAAMDGAGKSLFWKDKPVVESELRRWTSAELATLVDRMTSAQAQLLASGNAGSVLFSQELLTVARQAQRRS